MQSIANSLKLFSGTISCSYSTSGGRHRALGISLTINPDVHTELCKNKKKTKNHQLQLAH